MKTDMNPKTPLAGRPFLFKLLAGSLVLIALTGWLRLYQSFYQWEWLIRYEIRPGPVYTAIYGALIGLTASTNAILFWIKHKFAKRVIQISIPAILFWWWLDYLFFSKTALAFTNLPFRILLTITYLCFVYLYLRYSKHC
jgi:hypothetical protein